eukprot:scaffold33177_cov54-Attheya_sp.AAC.3
MSFATGIGGGAARTLTPKRTVVTAFSSTTPSAAAARGVDDVYEEGSWVLCVASSAASLQQKGVVSCALSDGVIRTYDETTLQEIHSIPGQFHQRGTISDLCHTTSGGDHGGASPLVVSSCTDGIVRIFDLRSSATSSAAIQFQLPKKGEQALSVSFGYDGTLAAVGGGKGHIHFFDVRGSSLLGSYVDAHTEEVTKVRFQPTTTGTSTTTSLLVSASEDGLACIHDTSQPTEELALRSVMNIQSPLRDVGFFGPSLEGLYCLTGSETMSVWHHDSAQRICNYFGTDLRTHLSTAMASSPSSTSSRNTATTTSNNIDYLVGCSWDSARQELSLLAGNSNGQAAMFKVDAGTMTFTHTLSGGHRGCVRSFTRTSCSSNGTQSNIILTGGEDARLCEWNLDHVPPPQPAAQGSVSTESLLTGKIEQTKQTQPSRGGPLRRERKKPTASPY